MMHGSQPLHFDLLIRPESGPGVCPVSLWAARGVGVGHRVFAGPIRSWLEYSRRLEEVQLLDARSLGEADACISRGEPTVQRLHCTRAALYQLGLQEKVARFHKGLRLLSLLPFRRGNSRYSLLPGVEPDGLHPRFCGPSERKKGEIDEEMLAASAHELAPAWLGSLTTDAPSALPKASAQILPARGIAGTELCGSLPSSIALLGVRVENLSMQEAVGTIEAMIADRAFHQVATANVDFLNKAFEDRELLEILHSCALVLPDGMPLIWASRLMGVPLKERVTGADLLPQLFAVSARKGYRIFLLGATEERSRSAVERIQRDFPEAIVCGRHCPPFVPLDEMDNAPIFEAIDQARPDLLLVAFGNPKQEKWIFRHRDRLRVPVCIGVGASIDFFSGRQSRAPMWMQRSGFEWVYRLLSEPRRLAMRYLGDGIFVLRYLSVQLLATALQPRGQGQTEVLLSSVAGTPVLRVAGTFSREAAKEVIDELDRYGFYNSLVLDLSDTRSIMPDAAGLIVELTHRCLRAGTELWIAGCASNVRTTMRATFPAGEPFHTALTLDDALRFVGPAAGA